MEITKKTEETKKVFTEEQEKAFKEIQNFIQIGSGGMHLLRGYAGTGKTFLVGQIMLWYNRNNPSKTIAVTAPTHKAVKVLRSMIPSEVSNYIARTTHSLLNLEEFIDGYGNIGYKERGGNNQKDNTEDVSLVIVDEASMLEDYIFNLLWQRSFTLISLNPIKILFVGDPAQIPPVNKKESMPFNVAYQKKYNIKLSTLRHIVRQVEDSSIILLSKEVRKDLNLKSYVSVDCLKEHRKNKDVSFIDFKDEENLHLWMENIFLSKHFKEDVNYGKIIAWRNATVKAFNNYIRTLLYDTEDHIVIGERIVLNAPLIKDKKVLLPNNTELIIKDYTIQDTKVKGKKIFYYNLTVLKEGCDDEEYSIDVIHEDSLDLFDAILQGLKNKALEQNNQKLEAKSLWRKWYSVKKRFIDINYNYAVTAHKSQGSTYTNALVIENDIHQNKNILERNHIKYTAFTRPSKHLVIVR